MKLQTSGVLGTSYAIAKLAPKRVLFMAGSKFNVIGFEEKISSQGQRYVEIILNEIN